MRMLERVLVAADTIAATQEISFRRPLTEQLKKKEIDLLMVDDSGHNLQDPEVCRKIWHSFQPTVVVFSRFSLAIRTELYAMAKAAAVPIVFHIDDNLLNVSPSLGKAKLKQYNNPERKEALRASMQNADTVYASTRRLAKYLSKEGITAHFSPGEIYCSVDPAQVAPYKRSSDPIIGYMGTSGHLADLLLVVPAIDRLMEERPGLQFHVFGSIASKVDFTRFGERFRAHETAPSYDAFLEQLSQLGWWVGLAPLERNTFNLCKADTKWVEYSLSGIPVAASEIEVYESACAGGCGVLVKDKEWYSAISSLLDDPELGKRMVDAAQSKLTQSYTHDRLASQIQTICRKTRERMQAPASVEK